MYLLNAVSNKHLVAQGAPRTEEQQAKRREDYAKNIDEERKRKRDATQPEPRDKSNNLGAVDPSRDLDAISNPWKGPSLRPQRSHPPSNFLPWIPGHIDLE
ncbi:hypothetical protein K402DRAFT_418726 [Aulographum hederae CBS 113979]|uniref:Uncharacterized protein n=1 Tax=Aulographum hederae CBS 113979 TaxID=1176131 RepID=A0A6G1H8A6_9PEZI|nr:hypothetical protein K402DRAFT_418726 [Aulographum hederae CBS 113979]